METKETLALQKAVEKFITKKINVIKIAQEFGKKIIDYGLLEPTKTLPFQILPTDMFDGDGDLICKIFVYIEHPMFGFFSIEILDDKCAITCPSIYRTEYFVTTTDECNKWIDELAKGMDKFYQLSSAAEEKQVGFCNLLLNELLTEYHNISKEIIENIKDKIESNPKTAIVTNNFYALVTNAKKNYNKALLLPSAWVIFQDLDNLPENNEQIDDYVDEKSTDVLFNQLNDFFKKENYLAAGVYLAQRICLQSGLIVKGFSFTDNEWQEAFITPDTGEFVLPPIDTKEFSVALAMENGPNRVA